MTMTKLGTSELRQIAECRALAAYDFRAAYDAGKTPEEAKREAKAAWGDYLPEGDQ